MADFQGREINRILIRSVNWIGDAVLTTPAISALRKNFPGAEIAILAKPYVSEIFKGNPDIDDIILYERSGFIEGVRSVKEIRKKMFDLAVLFQNAFEAALIAFLSGIPKRLGYATDGRGLLLNPSIPVKTETLKKHHLEYYIDLLKEAGMKAEKGPLVLRLSQNESEWAIDFLKKNGWKESAGLVGINPGAAYGPAKRWHPERFASVADRLMKEGVMVIIFGGPGDKSVVEDIKRRMITMPVIASGTSVRQLASLIERCSLFLTNDTGPMHMAAALKVPVIALFGSTDPDATGPVGEGQRIIYKKADCSPCFLRECPKDFRCMKFITEKEVFEAVREKLRD